MSQDQEYPTPIKTPNALDLNEALPHRGLGKSVASGPKTRSTANMDEKYGKPSLLSVNEDAEYRATAYRQHAVNGVFENASSAPHGHIKSFVKRLGHITPAQREAYQRLLPSWGIDYQADILDLEKAFGRQAPTILEIGFGMGETTAQIAIQNPDKNFLCLEIFTAGVGALLRRIEAKNINNIRIIAHDAVEVIRDMLAPEVISGVHIFFPDPWPKTRHHKRRLIQPEFIELLWPRLLPSAYIHCATDWQHYAEQMLSVLAAQSALENTVAGFSERPEWRPLTKFEQRGIRLGHGVWDILFKRKLAV